MRPIDPTLPIRSEATKRRLWVSFIEWRGPREGMFWVDLRESHGRTGFLYKRDGEPVEDNPFGVIENFEPQLASAFESIETVLPQDAYSPEKLARKRAAEREAMVDAMGDQTGWGMF